MIMSHYFNVQYLHQKMIRIYADIVQNHTLPGVSKLLEGSVFIYFCFFTFLCTFIYLFLIMAGLAFHNRGAPEG